LQTDLTRSKLQAQEKA